MSDRRTSSANPYRVLAERPAVGLRWGVTPAARRMVRWKRRATWLADEVLPRALGAVIGIALNVCSHWLAYRRME